MIALVSNYAFSQSKMNVGFVGSFDYNDYKYSESFLPRENDRKDNIGFSSGLSANFSIGSKNDTLFFQAGILYTEKRYYEFNEICTMIDLAPGAPPCPSITLNRLSFIEVPISIRKNYLKKPKISLFVSGGASALIKIDEQMTDDISTESKEYITIDNRIKVYPGLIFSTGLEYRISDKTSLQLTPLIKYYRTDFVDLLLIYGFGASFNYRFGKKEKKVKTTMPNKI